MPGTWLTKIEISAKPRQKSTALASRGIAASAAGHERQASLVAQPSHRSDALGSIGPDAGLPAVAHSAGVDEARDQRMGNGLLARQVQPFGMLPLQHQSGLAAGEPSCLGDLAALDGDIGALRLPEAANHQRMRERP